MSLVGVEAGLDEALVQDVPLAPLVLGDLLDRDPGRRVVVEHLLDEVLELLADSTNRPFMYVFFFTFAERANNSRIERGTEGVTPCDSEAAHTLARGIWIIGSLGCFFSSIKGAGYV